MKLIVLVLLKGSVGRQLTEAVGHQRMWNILSI